MAAFTSLPFFMQYVLSRTEVEIGLLLTPWPIATALTAILAGRLADKYSVGILCGIGLTIFAIGLILMGKLPSHATDITIMWRMAICGIGFGLFQTPNNRAIMNSVPLNRSSAAGATMSSARLLGQTIGAALVSLSFVIIPIEPTRTTLHCAGLLSFIAAGVSLLRHGERFRS
jgi:DHA2 family multidrug resistance protein-like MFS transporter